jgi:glycosyltransferase involved in cell wall biosynthesis
MTHMNLSTIICTHNPRADYLTRVLAALRGQTMPLDQWELLVVDNGSKDPLAPRVDLSWHPNARHIREDELGLTPARLRGIAESRADLIVFVDDDNVLSPDYLEEARRIAANLPFLGCWGGNITPEFETPPPGWTQPFWGYLAVITVTRDVWSNLPNQFDTTPPGAGMCVRRVVAEAYAQLCRNDPLRLTLDVKGDSLDRCGDTDLAYTACDLGMGVGRIRSLHLGHIIPARRLEESYLLQLCEGTWFSTTILHSLRGISPPSPKGPSIAGALLAYLRSLRIPARDRRFYTAKLRGITRASRFLHTSMPVTRLPSSETQPTTCG